MAITYVDVATYSSGAATTHAMSKPAATAEGDHLLASWSNNGPITVTPPDAGWTQVSYLSTTDYSHSVWQKRAGASEPTSYTWTFVESVNMAGGIVARRGVDSAAVEVSAEDNEGWVSDATINCPSVTTAGADRCLVLCYGSHAGGTTSAGTTFTPPTEFTERFDVQQASNAAKRPAGQSDKIQAASGATGAFTVAIDGVQGKHVGATVALKPAPTGTAHAQAATDPLGATDSITKAQGAVRTDALGATDSTTALRSRFQAETDALSATDSVIVQKSRSQVETDALGATDTVQTHRTLGVEVADGLGATDSTAVASHVVVEFEDALGGRDAVARNGIYYTEARVPVSAPSRYLEFGPASGEVRVRVNKKGAGTSHPTCRVELYETTDLENLGPLKATLINQAVDTETVLSGTFDQQIIETPANVVFRVVGDGVLDGTLEIHDLEWNAAVSDTPVEQPPILHSAEENISVSDTVSTVSQIRREVVDGVGLTDAAGRAIRLEVADGVGATDTQATSLYKHVAREITDGLGTTDTTTSKVSRAAIVTDSLGITDAPETASIKIHVVTDGLGLLDSLLRSRGIRVVDSLATTDSTARTIGLIRVLTDGIGITDDIPLNHRIAIIDALGLLDQVGEPFFGHVYGSVTMLGAPGGTTSLDGVPGASTVMAGVPTSGATLLGVPKGAITFLTPNGTTVLISPPRALTTMNPPPLAATNLQDNPRGAVTKWEHVG